MQYSRSGVSAISAMLMIHSVAHTFGLKGDRVNVTIAGCSFLAHGTNSLLIIGQRPCVFRLTTMKRCINPIGLSFFRAFPAMLFITLPCGSVRVPIPRD